MNNTNILIVEDNISFAIEIEMMLENLQFSASTIINNGEEAIRYIRKHRPNLIIMDVNLRGELTGIDIAEQIQEYNIPIIFMTAFDNPKTYQQAKQVLPYAYLPKPFDQRTLHSSIDLALARVHKEGESKAEQEVIYVKSNYQLKKVKLIDIQYLNSDGNYCMIQTSSKKYIMKISLTKIKQLLPQERFLQIHKSFIIQTSKIDRVDISNNKVFIAQNKLPLGRKYKKDLLAKLDNF